MIFEMVECGVIAKEQAIGFGAFDQFEITYLTRFDDAWGGEDDLGIEI